MPNLALVNVPVPVPAPSTTSTANNGVSRLVTYAQAAAGGPANTPQTGPTSTAIDLEPPTCASPNVHVFSLFDNWEIARIGVRFMQPAVGLRSVRTLNIFTADAYECAPSRIMQARHLWRRLVQVDIPSTKYNVVVHLTTDVEPPATDNSFDPSTTVEIRLSEGLPLTSNCLIFHYADFHGSENEGEGVDISCGRRRKRSRHCTRCNVPILQGSTCQNCNQNGNQCSRCLFINLTDEDIFLCTRCGSSNYNFISFSILARPNFFHVSRLRDEEDRRMALGRIVSLSEELNSKLVALESVRASIFKSVTMGHPPTSRATDILVPIDWPSDHVSKLSAETLNLQKNGIPQVCRIWALRQAVAIYDDCCSAKEDCANPNTTSIANVGDDRCLRCVEAVISQISVLGSSIRADAFPEDLRRECIRRGLTLLHYLSPIAQVNFMHFLASLTADSTALVSATFTPMSGSISLLT